MGACAAPAGPAPAGPETTGNLPVVFDIDTAVPLTTRDQVMDELAGRPLHFVHPSVEAELTFGDGTLEGTLMRPGEAPAPVLLDWEWVDGGYCRTGTIGGTDIDRKCQSITLHPDVGVEIDYLASDDPTEAWVFDRDAVAVLRSTR